MSAKDPLSLMAPSAALPYIARHAPPLAESLPSRSDDIFELIGKSDNIREASSAMQAMAHPLRLKILCLIGKEEVSVLEIVEAVGTTQSNVSQHLAVLRARGLLEARKEANKVYLPDRRCAGAQDDLPHPPDLLQLLALPFTRGILAPAPGRRIVARPGLDPPRTPGGVLALPEGSTGLEVIHDELARREGFAAMGARHSHQHDALSRDERAHAMDHHGVEDLPAPWASAQISCSAFSVIPG